MTVADIQLFCAILAVFLLPGWAFLAISGLWRPWSPLARWFLALSASIAFYPVWFYALRLLPALQMGPNKSLGLLLIAAALVVLGLRRHWAEQFRLDAWEWLALAVVLATIFSRFWTVRDLPFPAWTDSLHHSLITLLTANQGHLPLTLDPYAPLSLQMYHLGLYALTGTVMQLAAVPAHTALLAVAQTLNGLCAIGIYLVLERLVSRRAALVGLVVAGLLSFQPAWYVNWGRFTQLSSQVILPAAWLLTWETVRSRMPAAQPANSLPFWPAAWLAAVLNAAVFLLHFRVAAYYLPLVGLSLAYEWALAGRSANQPGQFAGATRRLLAAVGVLAALSLLFVLPVLLPAMARYIETAASASAPAAASSAYFDYDPQAILQIGLRPWLVALAGLAGLLGLARRNRLAWLVTLWLAALVIEGNLYQLGWRVLNFSNFSGIIILFYLPAALLVGIGLEECLRLFSASSQARLEKALVYGVLAAGFVASFQRTTDLDPFRYFIYPEDQQAMHWITANTPPDALFAINTYFWLPATPHGTDAGYWIPYFTGRKTTTGSMLSSLGGPAYRQQIQRQSQAVRQFIEGSADVSALCDQAIDYIYVGRNGNLLSPPLDLALIHQQAGAALVFQSGGTAIFQVCGP